MVSFIAKKILEKGAKKAAKVKTAPHKGRGRPSKETMKKREEAAKKEKDAASKKIAKAEATKEKKVNIKLSEVETFCKNADSRTVLNMLINYETFLGGLDVKIERFENAIKQSTNQESINDLKDFKEKQTEVRKQCDILLDHIHKVWRSWILITSMPNSTSGIRIRIAMNSTSSEISKIS